MAFDAPDTPAGASPPLVLAPAAGRSFFESCAQIVSQAGSPPVLTVALAFLAASLERSLAAFAYASLHSLLVALLPVAYLWRQLRRGAVSDLELYRREERRQPYLATLAGAGLAWTAIRFGGGPALLNGVAGVLTLAAGLLFAVTLNWKISLHCTMAGLAGALVWRLLGTPLPLLLGSPLMIWSRLYLRRHTPGQVVAGTLVGAVIGLVFFDRFAGGR